MLGPVRISGHAMSRLEVAGKGVSAVAALKAPDELLALLLPFPPPVVHPLVVVGMGRRLVAEVGRKTTGIDYGEATNRAVHERNLPLG